MTDREAPAPREIERVRKLTDAELLAARLDRPMGVLGLIFVLVVLGQVLAREPWLVTTFTVVGWICWAVFVAEFALRAHIAGWSAQFWRRSWWQVLFLAVPFLRFFRALALFRVARVARVVRLGGVLSAGVRGSRSAGRLLTGRLSWLAAVTAVVVLAASQLHYLIDGEIDYAEALYQTALMTVTGGGLEGDDVATRLLRLALAVYSVVVFATLAGSLGAFFLQRPDEQAESVAAVRD